MWGGQAGVHAPLKRDAYRVSLRGTAGEKKLYITAVEKIHPDYDGELLEYLLTRVSSFCS